MNKKYGSNDRQFQSDESSKLDKKEEGNDSRSINANKFVPEGVEGMVKVKGSVSEILH